MNLFSIALPGQYFDQETGLHYNWNRYYDPQLGRYITSDPIGLVAGPNTYAYALQNPILVYDQLGMKERGEWIQSPRILPGSINVIYGGLSPTLGIDRYLTILLVRLNFTVLGIVDAKVKCTDECDNVRTDSYHKVHSTDEHIDVGPNIIATAGGLATGSIVVSVVLNAVIVDLKLNAGLQKIPNNIEAMAEILNTYGPDAVCNYGWPEI